MLRRILVLAAALAILGAPAAVAPHPASDGFIARITFHDALHTPAGTFLVHPHDEHVVIEVQVWEDHDGDFRYAPYESDRIGVMVFYGDLLPDGPQWISDKTAYRGRIVTDADGKGSLAVPVSKLRFFENEDGNPLKGVFPGNAFAIGLVDNGACHTPQGPCPTSYHSFAANQMLDAGFRATVDALEHEDPMFEARLTLTPFFLVGDQH